MLEHDLGFANYYTVMIEKVKNICSSLYENVIELASGFLWVFYSPFPPRIWSCMPM